MISIRDAIDDWLAIHATRVRPSTVALQRIYLQQFLDWITAHAVFDLRLLAREHMEQYQAHLPVVEHRTRAGMKKLAASSRCERFAAVKRLLAWAVASGRLIVDPSVSVRRESRRQWQPANVITESEMVTFIEAIDRDAATGLRDRALLELMYSTGLRCAEVSALDLSDVDLTDGVVFVRYGKGAKQRLVPIGASAVETVKRYLIFARPLLVAHPHVQALFVIGHSRGKGTRLGKGGIRCAIERAARAASITRRVRPHTVRQSVATHLLRAGADLRHVQELLGHSRIDATERYTHLDVGDLAAAHARCHPRGKTRK